jgi:hypothetical protein
MPAFEMSKVRIGMTRRKRRKERNNGRLRSRKARTCAAPQRLGGAKQFSLMQPRDAAIIRLQQHVRFVFLAIERLRPHFWCSVV